MMDEMMDEWHRKLALDLGSKTPRGAPPSGAILLEIAFGRARSIVAYALELALAHRIPATGSIGGDDIWLRLGDSRVRFTMNRREGIVVAWRPKLDALQARWDEATQALVAIGADGEATGPVDLEATARASVDAIVADWRASPLATQTLSPVPPDFEDETTKG